LKERRKKQPKLGKKNQVIHKFVLKFERARRLVYARERRKRSDFFATIERSAVFTARFIVEIALSHLSSPPFTRDNDSNLEKKRRQRERKIFLYEHTQKVRNHNPKKKKKQ